MDESVSSFMLTKEKTNFHKFFYPEIKEFIKEGDQERIQSEISSEIEDISKFKKNRRKGENDSHICTLIRNDSIKEFSIYVQQMDLPLTSPVPFSIYETNSFLIKNHPTLIEYAAFYGSFKIFSYLLFKKAGVSSSIWVYAIYSRNKKLIHLLEDEKICFPNNSCVLCIKYSIKCHYNEIADYFINNYAGLDDTIKLNEALFESCCRFCNYQYFPQDPKSSEFFFGVCRYNYFTLVDLFLNDVKEELKELYEKSIKENEIFTNCFK
ncbi:hypothetical protein M9Y10_003209 [Tritrichomonas musculus]|uniref:DUF3447 domain-containing protein n=1 Tax=Tritrichomonas musculus TaxID=1915356 RepID=A0ABR2JNW2_9EUKA